MNKLKIKLLAGLFCLVACHTGKQGSPDSHVTREREDEELSGKAPAKPPLNPPVKIPNTSGQTKFDIKNATLAQLKSAVTSGLVTPNAELLKEALETGKEDIVLYLTDLVDVNDDGALGFYEASPLYKALSVNPINPTIAKKMIEKGRVGGANDAAFLKSYCLLTPDACTVILTNGVKISAYPDILINAIVVGDAKIVKILLAQKADPNASAYAAEVTTNPRWQKGNLPLFVAVLQASEAGTDSRVNALQDIISALISHGADAQLKVEYQGQQLSIKKLVKDKLRLLPDKIKNLF